MKIPRMNKRGGIQTFLNQGTILGLILLILFFVFGAGGGFTTVFDLGKFVAKIPVWFWLVIALLYLASQFRK